MEPRLDYLYGQNVDGIVENSEPWDWGIELASGSIIHNTDKRRTSQPGIIVGYTFVSYEEGETDVHLLFSMYRGPEEEPDEQTVTMTKNQMQIYDPAISDKPRQNEEEQDE